MDSGLLSCPVYSRGIHRNYPCDLRIHLMCFEEVIS